MLQRDLQIADAASGPIALRDILCHAVSVATPARARHARIVYPPENSKLHVRPKHLRHCCASDRSKATCDNTLVVVWLGYEMRSSNPATREHQRTVAVPEPYYSPLHGPGRRCPHLRIHSRTGCRVLEPLMRLWCLCPHHSRTMQSEWPHSAAEAAQWLPLRAHPSCYVATCTWSGRAQRSKGLVHIGARIALTAAFQCAYC